MTKCVRFSTAGSNLMTAMTVKEAVRAQLRGYGILYEEQSQLPYDVSMSDRDFFVFCLVWDSDQYPWREVEQGLQR